MEQVSPYSHPCDVGTIEYENINEGLVWCRECGKQWKLGARGWNPYPLVKFKPKERA